MSNFDPTTAWLLGDGPEPGEEAKCAFLEAEVPPELAQRTLAAAAVLFDQADKTSMRSRLRVLRGGRVRRLLLGTGTGLAMAAAVLLSLQSPPEKGNLEGMTQRGVGGVLPALDLRMAVRTGGELDRLRADRSYGSGDVFYFRYEAAADGWLHLVHASENGLEVLDSLPVTQGQADLVREGQPLTWTVDEADPDKAVFGLVRTLLPVAEGELETALRQALGRGAPMDPGTLCEAAHALELSCDAQAVKVQR